MGIELVARHSDMAAAAIRRCHGVADEIGVAMMAKTRGAIACHSIGSTQGAADTASAEELDIASISGTSGGAVCTALIWFACLKGDMILADAIRPEFPAQFDIASSVCIPRSFSTDTDKPYHIPCIEMSPELQETLDYQGKIDRSARHIELLIAGGADIC